MGQDSSIRDIYDAITKQVHVVDVGNVELRLTPPDPAAAKHIRDLQMQIAELQRGGTRPPLEELAPRTLALAGAALQACLPEGLSQEECEHLVTVTGGEPGMLGQLALRLCGISADVVRAVDAGDLDDPT